MANALVTGTRRGLGRALAEKLRSDGWEVRTLDRDRVDLADHGAIPGAVAGAISGVDRLDLVILNAGVLGAIGDLRDRTVDEVRAAMDVNVWANKVVLDAVLALPVAHVIAISTGAAIRGAAGLGPYSISKAALNRMVEVYAREHPATHFTAVAPGHVATDMMATIQEAPGDPRYATLARIKKSREGPLMQTPEAAAARLIGCLPQLRAAESGAYVDVRNLPAAE